MSEEITQKFIKMFLTSSFFVLHYFESNQGCEMEQKSYNWSGRREKIFLLMQSLLSWQWRILAVKNKRSVQLITNTNSHHNLVPSQQNRLPTFYIYFSWSPHHGDVINTQILGHHQYCREFDSFQVHPTCGFMQGTLFAWTIMIV